MHDVTIDGSTLADFADAYNVVIVCGLVDPAVDRYEQTRIAASAPFTIASAPITIRVNHSPSMVEVMEAAVEEATAAFRASNPEVPIGTPLLIQIQSRVWTEVILLPKGVASTEIHRLSDVPRFQGKIVSRELQEGRLRQSV
jgi:hypothetical protein